MRTIRLGGLWAGTMTLLVIASLTIGAVAARAQNMGEYGTTVGGAGTIGQSSATLPPPAVHTNPVGGGGGSTSSIDVASEARRVEDTSTDRDDRDARDPNHGDEWSPAH